MSDMTDAVRIRERYRTTKLVCWWRQSNFYNIKASDRHETDIKLFQNVHSEESKGYNHKRKKLALHDMLVQSILNSLTSTISVDFFQYFVVQS